MWGHVSYYVVRAVPARTNVISRLGACPENGREAINLWAQMMRQAKQRAGDVPSEAVWD